MLEKIYDKKIENKAKVLMVEGEDDRESHKEIVGEEKKKAARQKKHQLLLAEAVAWCNEHSKGGKLAMKEERFASTDLTARKINYALTNPIVQRNKYDVLTSVELTRLKEWIRSAEAVTDQARQLLRPRARLREAHRGPRGAAGRGR